MSLGRFAGYFLALIACATAAFSALPNSAAAPPAAADTTPPVQVALAP